MKMQEVLGINAQSKRGGKDTKKLDSVRIRQADNGGHIVEHHFSSESGRYHEPEQHVFSDGEQHAMLAHVANALKLPEPKAE